MKFLKHHSVICQTLSCTCSERSSENPDVLMTLPENLLECIAVRVALPAHFPLWLGSPLCKCSPPAGPASSRPFPWSALSSLGSPPSRLLARQSIGWKKNNQTDKLLNIYQKRKLTCEHGVKIGTPCSQHHPVSGDLHVLRHYGHVAQQALAT